MRALNLGAVVLALMLGGCGKDPSPGGQQGSRVPPRPSPSPGQDPVVSPGKEDVARGYAGSSTCKACHEPEYYYWLRTPHSYMAKTMEIERQVPGSPTSSVDFPYAMEEVALVLGTLKKQVYLTKVGDEYRFLPKQHNLALKTWEPFDIDEWEPSLAHGAGEGTAGPPTWNDRCAGCHTTGYDPSRRTFVELSVACEECHGPGARHAKTKKKDDIVNPRSLPPDRAMSICAQCHARGVTKDGKSPFASGFLPGEDIADYMTHVEPVEGENTPFFWGNGMAAKHHQQYQEFIQSRHHYEGVTCLDCHMGHRLKLREPPSRSRVALMTVERQFLAARTHSVCTKCHVPDVPEGPTSHVTTLFTDVEAHTHHPPSINVGTADLELEPGSPKRKMLCNDCHMPRTAPTALSFSMHTHTFRVPDIDATERYGVPNGCISCHTDQDSTWAKNQIRTIWLTGDVVRAHCQRFAEEFTKTRNVWGPPKGYLSAVPPDRYPQAQALAERLASFEKVASSAATIANSSIERATPSSEIDYSTHEEVRRAETLLYSLTRDLLTFREKVSTDLRSMVDAGALAALNHVLDATGETQWEVPKAAETYVGSEDIYREFNTKVQEKGRDLFERRGLKTTWQDWLNIYVELKAGKLTKTYADRLEELASLGIIRYEVQLKK